MAPLINDVIRVVCVFSRATTPDVYTNTYHFKVLAPGWADNLAFMNQIAQYLDDSYAIVNSEIASGIQYVHIDGQNVTQSVLMPLVSWPFLTAGGNVSDQLPTQVCARPYWPTTRPKTRPAICLPPFGESSQGGGGLIDATALTFITTYTARLVGNIILAGGTCVYGAYNPEFLRFTPVDSAIIPDRFRTLRRRRVGVGS